MNDLDWRRIALRDQDQNCPYTGCTGTINVLRQSLEAGSGVFVCPECDRRSFMDKEGKLATKEEYAKVCDDACET